jgi:ankyrin repeat protein
MNKKGWTALHYALHTKNAHPSVIESFINDSKNPNRLTDNGDSPLTIALKNDTLPISVIRLLLEKGAKVDVKDEGHSYVYKTLLNDNPLEITKLLIDNGSVLTKHDVETLKKADLHVTDNDQKLIDCMKKIGKSTSTSTSLDKYRLLFVKLYNIDERLVNQFIKAFKKLSELKNL